MISIRPRKNGFILHLDGLIAMPAMTRLTFQLRDELAGMSGPFVLVIDARTFTGFTADAQARFEELLEEAVEAGLARVSLLGISTAYANLFCNIMVRSEVMPIYQFLDLAYEEDFRTEMENWLKEPFAEEPTA